MRAFLVPKVEVVRVQVSMGAKALYDAQVQQRPREFIELGKHYMVAFDDDSGAELDRLARGEGVVEFRSDQPVDTGALAEVAQGSGLAVDLDGKSAEEMVAELKLAGMAKQSMSVYTDEQRAAVLEKMQQHEQLAAMKKSEASEIKVG